MLTSFHVIIAGTHLMLFNTWRPRQNERHFADDIFQCIFLNENILISIKISLKFVPKGPINNIPALVQIMAWRRPGDKPLSEPMMSSQLTHICVTRPQWDECTDFFILPLFNVTNQLITLTHINSSYMWRHDMEMLTALLAILGEFTGFTDGLPSPETQ